MASIPLRRYFWQPLAKYRAKRKLDTFPEFMHRKFAMDALQVLNREIKRYPYQHTFDDNRNLKYWVYSQKFQLIHFLASAQKHSRINVVKQKANCWNCGGTGRHRKYRWGYAWTEGCWKCDGTGVHHWHLLVEFTFPFGKDYIWHQPLNQIPSDWYEMPHEELVPIYKEGTPQNTPAMNAFEMDVQAYLLQLYLQKYGLPTQSYPMEKTAKQIGQEIKLRGKAAWRSLRWKISAALDWFQYGTAVEEDYPF